MGNTSHLGHYSKISRGDHWDTVVAIVWVKQSSKSARFPMQPAVTT
jgi:hypothetical protein